mgnify:FL=1
MWNTNKIEEYHWNKENEGDSMAWKKKSESESESEIEEMVENFREEYKPTLGPKAEVATQPFNGMQNMQPVKKEVKKMTGTSQTRIEEVIEEIKMMLLAKNEQYGDSALSPNRIFSKASTNEQIKVRIDDKLNRLMLGNDSIESDEDVIRDLIGYLILLLVSYDLQRTGDA